MPIIIIESPISFFFVILSFKNSLLNIATNIYPADSSMGPKDRGILVYARTEHKVAPKNIIYANITLGFKYSFILLPYST